MRTLSIALLFLLLSGCASLAPPERPLLENARPARILIFAFLPYEGMAINISEDVAKKIKEDSVMYAGTIEVVVLPVMWIGSTTRITSKINEFAPDIIIGMGRDPFVRQMQIEKNFYNVANVADDGGVVPDGRVVVNDGPYAYSSNVDSDPLLEYLAKKNISATANDSEGKDGFLCNFLGYTVMHELKTRQGNRKNVRFMFLHLPTNFWSKQYLIWGAEETLIYLANEYRN